nr:hypothetical protein Ade03nite_45490 [Actinoplanes derwentensis]
MPAPVCLQRVGPGPPGRCRGHRQSVPTTAAGRPWGRGEFGPGFGVRQFPGTPLQRRFGVPERRFGVPGRGDGDLAGRQARRWAEGFAR